MFNILITSLIISVIIVLIIIIVDFFRSKEWFTLATFKRFETLVLIFLVSVTGLYIVNRVLSTDLNNLSSTQVVKYSLVPLNFVDVDSRKNYIFDIDDNTLLVSYIKHGVKTEAMLSKRNIEMDYNDKCDIEEVSPVFKNNIEQMLLGDPIVSKAIDADYNYYIINAPKKSITYLIR